MSRCSPETPLVEHQGVLEVAEVIESVRLDVEGEGVLGVVREDGVHILQGLQARRIRIRLPGTIDIPNTP